MTTKVHPLDDKDNPSAAYEWAIDTEHAAEWGRFRESKGLGLTREQLTGARMFHEWLRKDRRSAP